MFVFKKKSVSKVEVSFRREVRFRREVQYKREVRFQKRSPFPKRSPVSKVQKRSPFSRGGLFPKEKSDSTESWRIVSKEKVIEEEDIGFLNNR